MSVVSNEQKKKAKIQLYADVCTNKDVKSMDKRAIVGNYKPVLLTK